MWSRQSLFRGFSIILEKIMNKNNVNHLSRVPKHEVLNTKKLKVITRQGTKLEKIKEKTLVQ